MKKAFWQAMVVAVALVAGQTAQAVVITGGGSTLFNDDLEGHALGGLPSGTPANPGPGTWTIVTANGSVVVTNAGAPGAPEGSQYLALTRNQEGPPSNMRAYAVQSAPQSTVGDVVHTEFMMYIPTGSPAGLPNVQVQSPGGTARAGILPMSDGSLKYLDGGWQPMSITYQHDTWQKWEIDYLIGASKFTTKIDGVAETTNVTSTGDVGRFFFQSSGGAGANRTFYVDSAGGPALPPGKPTIAFVDGTVHPGAANPAWQTSDPMHYGHWPASFYIPGATFADITTQNPSRPRYTLDLSGKLGPGTVAYEMSLDAGRSVRFRGAGEKRLLTFGINDGTKSVMVGFEVGAGMENPGAAVSTNVAMNWGLIDVATNSFLPGGWVTNPFGFGFRESGPMHNYGLYVDPITGVVDLLYDGATVLSGFPYASLPNTAVLSAVFGDQTIGAGDAVLARYGLDDVLLRAWTPEPSSAVLLSIGLLGVVRRRRRARQS